MALEGRALLSTFTVNSTADDGSAGTLRWAVAQANANNQADTIDFSSLFNTPQTISLTTGQLALTDKATTTITGPGANLLTISGNHASQVFDIEDGGSAALSGLTISGGKAAPYGGGVRNGGSTLSLTDCTITGNAALRNGGGLYNAGGTTTLTGCNLSGNTANYGGGLASAGGTTTLTNCTVTANSGTTGGGLASVGGTTTLSLTGCTVSGNTAYGNGGGLYTKSLSQ
jgi:predicted outer membrane repeat protein